MSSESKVTVEVGRGSSAIEAARNLSAGTVPSNQVMLDTLSAAQNSVAQNSGSLDQHGQKIARDSEQLIEATKNLLLERNRDEKLQQILLSGKDAAQTGAKGDVVGPRNQAKLVGSDLSRTARDLAQLLGQSTELRGLFADQMQVLQRLFYKRQNQNQGYTQGVPQYTTTQGVPQYTTTQGVPQYTTQGGSYQQLHQGLQYPQAYYNIPTSTVPSSNIPSSQVPVQAALDPNFTTITLTQEEKNELIKSWTQLITRLGSKPSYGNAMNDVFTLFDHLEDLQQETRADPTAQEVKSQSSNTAYEVREFAERFMGGKTLEGLLSRLRELYRYTTQHPEMRQYGNELSNFFSETMRNPELLHDQQTKYRMDQLVDSTVYWMNNPYFRDQSRAIVDEAREILEAVKQDPALNEIQDSFNQLFHDVLQDANGNLSVSQLSASLPALKNLLAPILIEQFNNIPINRISGVTPKYDFELSNVVLSASDLVPDRFFLDVHTKADVGLSGKSNDRMITALTLKVSHITANMKNVNFAYARKKLPRMSDEGIVDVSVPQPGAAIKMVWEFRTSSKKPFTVVFRKAKCNVETVNVTVVKAKHSILDKIATKLFAGQMTARLENAVSDGLTSMGNNLADRMNRAVRHQAQRPSETKVGAEIKDGAATVTISGRDSNTTPAAVGRT